MIACVDSTELNVTSISARNAENAESVNLSPLLKVSTQTASTSNKTSYALAAEVTMSGNTDARFTDVVKHKKETLSQYQNRLNVISSGKYTLSSVSSTSSFKSLLSKDQDIHSKRKHFEDKELLSRSTSQSASQLAIDTSWQHDIPVKSPLSVSRFNQSNDDHSVISVLPIDISKYSKESVIESNDRFVSVKLPSLPITVDMFAKSEDKPNPKPFDRHNSKVRESKVDLESSSASIPFAPSRSMSISSNLSNPLVSAQAQFNPATSPTRSPNFIQFMKNNNKYNFNQNSSNDNNFQVKTSQSKTNAVVDAYDTSSVSHTTSQAIRQMTRYYTKKYNLYSSSSIAVKNSSVFKSQHLLAFRVIKSFMLTYIYKFRYLKALHSIILIQRNFRAYLRRNPKNLNDRLSDGSMTASGSSGPVKHASNSDLISISHSSTDVRSLNATLIKSVKQLRQTDLRIEVKSDSPTEFKSGAKTSDRYKKPVKPAISAAYYTNTVDVPQSRDSLDDSSDAPFRLLGPIAHDILTSPQV